MKALESRIKKLEERKKESLKFVDKGYGVDYKGEIYYSKDELVKAHHLEDDDVMWIKTGMWGFYDDIEKGDTEGLDQFYDSADEWIERWDDKENAS